MAGRGAVSLRTGFANRFPGRCRAPPGSTTRPCQELADDREVYQTLAVASLDSVHRGGTEPQQDKGPRRDTHGESGAGSG